MDRKTCGFCRNMNGRKFRVSSTAARVNLALSSDPQAVKVTSPFITDAFKNPDEMDGLSNKEILSKGITGIPSYHPACRGTIVAVI